MLGYPSRLGGPAIHVTQTLSLSLWISLSPHLTQSESHWFSIYVVLSMSHSVSIIFLSCPLAEPDSTWDLSSPATDGSRASCLGSAWAAGAVPFSFSFFLISCSLSLHSHWLLSVSPCPVSPLSLWFCLEVPHLCSLSRPAGLSVSAFPFLSPPLPFPFCLPISLPIFSFSSTS